MQGRTEHQRLGAERVQRLQQGLQVCPVTRMIQGICKLFVRLVVFARRHLRFPNALPAVVFNAIRVVGRVLLGVRLGMGRKHGPVQVLGAARSRAEFPGDSKYS